MALRRQKLKYALTLASIVAVAVGAAGCTDAGNGSILYCEVSEETSGFATDVCGENKRSGDVELSSTSEATDIAGVTWIDGSLVIEGVEDGQSDLSALRDVRCVERDLIVRGTALTGIDALSALRYVGGDLIIGERESGNPALLSLAGLQELTSVEGHVWIQSNPKLTSLEGLDSLSFVGDMLAVVGNDALTRLDGLAGLEHLGGFLNVAQNPSLPTCEAVALSEQLASECRNVCVRENSADGCPNEEELCWYGGDE